MVMKLSRRAESVLSKRIGPSRVPFQITLPIRALKNGSIARKANK